MTDSENSMDAMGGTHNRSGAVFLIVVTYMEERDALWFVAYSEEDNNTPRMAKDACWDISRAFRFLCRDDYSNDLKGQICQSFFTLTWCEQHVAIVPYIAAIQQHQQPQFAVQLQTANVSSIQKDKGNKKYDQWIVHKDSGTIRRAYSKSPFLYMEPIPAQITLKGKGMHRTLSYEINFSETEIVNHTMIQLLRKELYVEHEMNYNCRIRSYDNQHSCHIIQLAQPKVMDIEQPAFVSSQHVIAYNIVAHMNKQMDSIHRDRTVDPTVIVEFDTTIHFRYPLTDNTRMIQVTIDPPYLINNNNAGSSSGVNHYFKDAYWKSSNVIVTTVPAGSDTDLWYVSIITALVVWFGCIKMLRDIIRISSQQRRKKQH